MQFFIPFMKENTPWLRNEKLTKWNKHIPWRMVHTPPDKTNSFFYFFILMEWVILFVPLFIISNGMSICYLVKSIKVTWAILRLAPQKTVSGISPYIGSRKHCLYLYTPNLQGQNGKLINIFPNTMYYTFNVNFARP